MLQTTDTDHLPGYSLSHNTIVQGGNAVGQGVLRFRLIRSFVLLACSLMVFVHQEGLAQALQQPVFSPQLKESLPLIQADRVHQLGITGEGIGVAIVDIFTPNPKDPCRSAHGLWIEGIIKAVAPGANLERFNIRTVPSNQPRTCYLMSNSDINRALRQILAKHKQLGIRVVNLSWGGGKYANPCQMRRSETSDLLQKIVDQGMTVIAAAGNEGFRNALIWPACLPAAISVGASFDYDSQRPERTSVCEQEPVVDRITCYSNTASFLDVVAPGSRASVSSQLSGLGTSASTAFTSGVAALLLQAAGTLSPSDVRRTLSETGKSIVDPRNGLTFPRIDALNAVNSVLPKTPQASQPDGAVGLSLQAVNAISSLQEVRFQIQGSGVETAQVLVFDLSGNRLYDSGMTSPTALAWKLTTERGQRVANGVYLYIIRIRGSGTEQTSAVHKLAVVR